ncbi:MAG TPA: hypothetical protein VIJ63_18985, partial [Roseiarcus sp.]
ARDEPDDRGCAATPTGRFRRTIAELEKSWAAEARNAPFYLFVTWTPDGPRLGAERRSRGTAAAARTTAFWRCCPWRTPAMSRRTR